MLMRKPRRAASSAVTADFFDFGGAPVVGPALVSDWGCTSDWFCCSDAGDSTRELGGVWLARIAAPAPGVDVPAGVRGPGGDESLEVLLTFEIRLSGGWSHFRLDGCELGSILAAGSGRLKYKLTDGRSYMVA